MKKDNQDKEKKDNDQSEIKFRKSKKKKITRYHSAEDDLNNQSDIKSVETKTDKKKEAAEEAKLNKIKQAGFEASQKKQKKLSTELKSEIKKENEHSKKLPKWAMLLITFGVLGAGVGGYYGYHYYQQNYSQQATGKGLTPVQQASFVHVMRKYVTANWRPADLIKAYGKRYQNFDKKNKLQLSYLMYRSQQNSALYYNSFMYFLQAEFSYYDIADQPNPLYPNAKTLGNKTIPATFSDIRDNHEFIEYTGGATFEVMPNFEWLNKNYYTTDDFKTFLNIAQQEVQDPIFKNGKVDTSKAYHRMCLILNWVANHPNSDLEGDGMSLAKFYYMSIFRLNNATGITKVKKGYKFDQSTLQDIQKITKKKYPFYNDLKNFINNIKHDGYMSSALRVSYQTIANGYFGDSVYDSLLDSIGGAPKQEDHKVKTVYHGTVRGKTDNNISIPDRNTQGKNTTKAGKDLPNINSANDEATDKSSKKTVTEDKSSPNYKTPAERKAIDEEGKKALKKMSPKEQAKIKKEAKEINDGTYGKKNK